MTQPTQHPPMDKGVVANLALSDASGAAEFYKKAFGAEEMMRMLANDGKRLMHCHMKINGGSIIINDCFPEYGHPVQTPQGYALHMQVDDVQAWWDRALAAGAAVAMPLAVQFWGDTYGQVTDPYGVTWSMGQHSS
jgi:PhnB protein